MTYTHRLEIRRGLNQEQTAKFERLLAKDRLSEQEAGALRGLAQGASETQQQQVRARLAPTPTPTGSGGGSLDPAKLGTAFGKALAKALDRGRDDA